MPNRTRATSPWLVLAVLCAAVVLINLSTTIMNTALPTLVRDLDASTRELLWIVDAFNLAFAALVLAAGSLSDRFGRRRAPALLFDTSAAAGPWCWASRSSPSPRPRAPGAARRGPSSRGAP